MRSDQPGLDEVRSNFEAALLAAEKGVPPSTAHGFDGSQTFDAQERSSVAEWDEPHRAFASFRVARISVFAGHQHFCSGFDFRAAPQRKAYLYGGLHGVVRPRRPVRWIPEAY